MQQTLYFRYRIEEKKHGVVTHSSGNHAAALALAASMNGVKANIVMPETAPVVKKNAVAGYGAEITFCKPTLQAQGGDNPADYGRNRSDTCSSL